MRKPKRNNMPEKSENHEALERLSNALAKNKEKIREIKIKSDALRDAERANEAKKSKGKRN